MIDVKVLTMFVISWETILNGLSLDLLSTPAATVGIVRAGPGGCLMLFGAAGLQYKHITYIHTYIHTVHAKEQVHMRAVLLQQDEWFLFLF